MRQRQLSTSCKIRYNCSPKQPAIISHVSLHKLVNSVANSKFNQMRKAFKSMSNGLKERKGRSPFDWIYCCNVLRAVHGSTLRDRDTFKQKARRSCWFCSKICEIWLVLSNVFWNLALIRPSRGVNFKPVGALILHMYASAIKCSFRICDPWNNLRFYIRI